MNLDDIVWIFRKAPSGCVTFKNVLSDEEIALILTYGTQLKSEQGFVGGDNTEAPLRSSEISWVLPNPETEWLYKKLNTIILSVNLNHFNFNLFGLEALQFSAYKSDVLGRYGKHVDTLPTSFLRFNRKLSFTVQLTDADQYEGGDLSVHTAAESDSAPRDKGSITFFPSNMQWRYRPRP